MAEPAACAASGCMEALLFVASSSEADLSANFSAGSTVRTGGAISADLFACDFASFLGLKDGSTNTKSLAAEALSNGFISPPGAALLAIADLLEGCSFRTSLLPLPGTSS